MAWPTPDLPLYGWFLLTGACTGFLSGLLGIGGGLVLVPAFLAIFHAWYQLDDKFAVQMALGTTMACMVVNALCSTAAQNRKQCVAWDVLARMWPWLCIGTALGVWFTGWMDATAIKACFGAYCLFSGYRMVRRKAAAGLREAPQGLRRSVVFAFALVCGLVGTGGANLFVPYLMRGRGLDLRQAMGSAAALQIPVALVGAAAFLVLGVYGSGVAGLPARFSPGTGGASAPGAVGFIFGPALLLVSAAAPFCTRAGVAVAHRMPIARLRWIFGAFTLLVGARMLVAAAL